MSNYAGVDWAADKHDVRVCDKTGEELLAATFAHDERGLRALCRALLRLKVELVAIERPDGLLVERLLDAGLRVLPMHPKQVAAARARCRAAGGKSDRFDAFVLCELARTDSHRFRVLEPDADPRAGGSRARQSGAVQPVARGAGALLARPDRPVHQARQPDLARVPGALPEPRRRARSGRAAPRGVPGAPALLRWPATHRAALKAQARARGRVGEAELAARRALVLALVTAIKPLVAQIKQLTEQIATALREHPDGEIFLSLFRDPRSVVTAAELLAEIGDCRARYPTRDTLAADAGQAAVAVESGKRKTASFRWGCNKRLRGAFCTLADSTRHWHPWAQDRYAAARARGHEHPRALRTLGRAWCRIVWRCWQDRTPYDPAKHRALQQHCTVTVPTSSGSQPDLAATQRMLGAAVTSMAARRAEREALDGKPTSAITLGG